MTSSHQPIPSHATPAAAPTALALPPPDEAEPPATSLPVVATTLSAVTTTLPTAVAQRLRELIIEGELEPGSRLNERALGERLGVSRTPLREALRLLAAEDLVVLEPNRGARVIRLSAADVRESFEVMSGLEALSGELACARIEPGELTEIKALTFEMLACHARRDLPRYYRINHAIHACINRAARNRLLTEVYERLNRRIQNLRFRSNFDVEKWNRAARDHAAMVEALEARDGPGLAALLRRHLLDKGAAVLDQLGAAGGDAIVAGSDLAERELAEPDPASHEAAAPDHAAHDRAAQEPAKPAPR